MHKKGFYAFVLLFFASVCGMGHPMPHSTISLDVKETNILADIKIPLKELQMAVNFDVTERTDQLLQSEKTKELHAYLLAHIKALSIDGVAWNVEILELQISESQQEGTGVYQELTAIVRMQPPAGQLVRKFNFYYDAIVHQVVTHKIFVTVKQDWLNGKTDGTEQHVGVIELSIADNQIVPLHISLDEGSLWRGFVSMVWLGINHIAEGFDHLLFLLVLLLPATLAKYNGRWSGFAGERPSLINILKIVTAFTIGHSVSLLIGAKQWLTLPQQPVEIAIAGTIFLAAIHALWPILRNHEVSVAALFGLIHGLAFSSVLSELHLDAKELTYSILGYNIGIELMQIIVLFLCMPWIMILSKNNHFKGIRIGGALFAMIASAAWALERITLQPNTISQLVDQCLAQGKWLVAGLMVMAAISHIWKQKQSLVQHQ